MFRESEHCSEFLKLGRLRRLRFALRVRPDWHLHLAPESPYPNTDTNAVPEPYADGNKFSNTNADTYGHSHTRTHCHAHWNVHRNLNADAHSRFPNSNTHALYRRLPLYRVYSDPHPYADPAPDINPMHRVKLSPDHPNTDSHADTYGHSHTRTHCNVVAGD